MLPYMVRDAPAEIKQLTVWVTSCFRDIMGVWPMGQISDGMVQPVTQN
jgi:hypothetical protein